MICSSASKIPATNNNMIDSHPQDNNKILSFPAKLYDLLENSEVRGYSHIVSWQKEGRSFKIHNVQEFADTVMASSFSQTKLKSFQRQLNMYGWKKVQVGPNKGGYYHRDFIRGCPELCSSILRRRVKDIGSVSLQRKSNSFESLLASTTRHCHAVKEITRHHMNVTSTAGSSSTTVVDRIRLDESEVATLFDFFYPKDVVEENSVLSFLDDDIFVPQSHSTPTAAAPTVSPFATNNNNNNMDLDDFVKVLENQTSLSQSRRNCELEQEPDHMHESPDNCFPYKLHLMLENAERDNYSHIVSWVKGGTAFKVHDTKAFVARVLPMFFDQSKYESFRRQLNLYFFSREARGPDRGTISHPKFIQGERWMCEEIKQARFLRR